MIFRTHCTRSGNVTRTGSKMLFANREELPAGAKAHIVRGPCGTAEAVPFLTRIFLTEVNRFIAQHRKVLVYSAHPRDIEQ